MNEKIEVVKRLLTPLYNAEGAERVGFISNSNEVIEVPNASNEPENGFIVATRYVIDYATGQSWATWHTHPGASANLSGEDYNSFKVWDKMVHFIIGNDGVRAYQWDAEKKVVINL